MLMEAASSIPIPTSSSLYGLPLPTDISADTPAIMASTGTPEETPWDPKTSQKFENKRPGEFFDPCQEAASRSLKCLHRNGGDREMCTDYFQAYRDCKKQWIAERKETKRKEGKSWFS